MPDCIASYHLSPRGCGVAKFSAELARRLGVPHEDFGAQATHMLLSVKASETPDWYHHCPLWAPYDLFFHDAPTMVDSAQMRRASHVYAANAAVAEAIRPYRPDVIQAWCPSTVDVADLQPMTRILTFGMAHKLAQQSYFKLKLLLDCAGADYAIGISVAIHDGTDWQESFAAVEKELTGVFGAKAHLFGSLADAGLSATLQSATAMAAFFPGGVRTNNTTVMAALEHGCPVVTNLDEYSPPELIHGETCFDVQQLIAWPDAQQLQDVGRAGRQVARQYSWARLVEKLR